MNADNESRTDSNSANPVTDSNLNSPAPVTGSANPVTDNSANPVTESGAVKVKAEGA